MSYEPLHHKYRPQTFAELVGQDAIAITLRNAIHTQRIAPAYLFTGPRGTGKTSSARIMAKSLNCLTSDKPTEKPCGVCDVCQGINKGSTLDVIEIDAASNTGVDNIREIIERAQFAPVQCRYKVYVIDECLTGDSLVQTSEGLIRIDDPSIKGRKVLSYNDSLKTWEFKKVVRWLDRGERQTLTIKTTNREIRCTGNHLIRTEHGWIAAKDVKEGVKILSPVNVAAEPYPQWITSLEVVESVKADGLARVYDIEVQSNHNFVANGLLVHNCHMLSTAAFNSLLKTLEEPPDRVVFILATTDPQRVLPTIISRCQRFDYRRIPLEAMVTHLSAIAVKENINIAPEAVLLVAQIAQGGLRDAESLLDQLSLLPDQVTVERIWELVGSCSEPDLLDLLQAIAGHHPEAILDCARRIMDRGREPLTVLQNLAGFYRDLLIAKTSPNRSDLVILTSPTWKALCELACLWDMPTILAGQKHLKDSEVQIKHTTQPRLWLEMTLLGLLPTSSSQPLVSLAETGIQPDSIEIANQQQLKPDFSHQQTLTAPVASAAETPPLVSKENPLPISPLDTNSTQPEPVTEVERSPSTSAEPAPKTQEQVWQVVLAQVEPESTKQMLRQLSHLIEFEGNVARVSLPQKWQEKLTNVRQKIEAAFQKTLNRQVKVILQTVAPQANTASFNESHQRSPSPPSSQITAAPPSVPQANQLPSHLAPTASSQQIQMHSEQAEITSITHSSPPPGSESPANSLSVSTNATEVDEDEVAIAAKRLAKAVNGEVIGLDLDLSFQDEATTPSQLPTAIPTADGNDADSEDEFDFF